MSNTPKPRRPSLAAKSSKRSEADRKAALEQGMRVTLDGQTYEVRMGDVTPQIARELRAQVGFGFIQLIEQMDTVPDVDLVAAFVWVARRVRGERVALDEVEMDYGDLFDADPEILDATDEPEATGPEA